MNIFKHVLGWMMSKLLSVANEYKQYMNKKSVGKIGNNSSVSSNVILAHAYNVSIGKNTYINGGSIIASPNATIEIGDNCLISYNVHMRTDMHNYSNARKLINMQGTKERSIVIGNDVWIGYGAQIMGGGKHC